MYSSFLSDLVVYIVFSHMNNHMGKWNTCIAIQTNQIRYNTLQNVPVNLDVIIERTGIVDTCRWQNNFGGTPAPRSFHYWLPWWSRNPVKVTKRYIKVSLQEYHHSFTWTSFFNSSHLLFQFYHSSSQCFLDEAMV